MKEPASPRVVSDQTIDEALASMRFNAEGLIPAIAQEQCSGEVLMMAWMNASSIAETLRTGRVCYWSRSRASYWRKGETSGNVQMLREMRIDCDGDSLLLLVEQRGPACHTGRGNCFFRAVKSDRVEVISEPEVDPKTLYGDGKE